MCVYTEYVYKNVHAYNIHIYINTILVHNIYNIHFLTNALHANVADLRLAETYGLV